MVHDLVRFMVAPGREATAYATGGGFRLMLAMERKKSPSFCMKANRTPAADVRYWAQYRPIERVRSALNGLPRTQLFERATHLGGCDPNPMGPDRRIRW